MRPLYIAMGLVAALVVGCGDATDDETPDSSAEAEPDPEDTVSDETGRDEAGDPSDGDAPTLDTDLDAPSAEVDKDSVDAEPEDDPDLDPPSGDAATDIADDDRSERDGGEEEAEVEAEVSGDRPPSAYATSAGQQVRMTLGGYCWTDDGGDRRCRDSFGVVLGDDVIELGRGDTVAVHGFDGTSTRVGGNVRELEGDGEQRGSTRVWIDAPIAQRLDDPDLGAITIDVPPGRYALELLVTLPAGEVTYAVQLEVT